MKVSKRRQTGRGFRALSDQIFWMGFTFLMVVNLIFNPALPTRDAYAYEVAKDDQFGQYCLDKSQFAKATVEYRDHNLDDWRAAEKGSLADLKKQYDESPALPHYVYVDLQSIVRRAFRNHGNGFRIKDPEAFAGKIFGECLGQGF